MLREFKKFAMRGSVIDMAVGIVIGAAFTAVVKSLVDHVLTPPLGALTGGLDFSAYRLPLGSGEGAAAIDYGRFLTDVIGFLVVALALFFVVRTVNRLRAKEEEGTPQKPPQQVVLEDIRALLRTHVTGARDREAGDSSASPSS